MYIFHVHLNRTYFLINNIYELSALNSAWSLSILSERAETLWAHEWKSIFFKISRLILTLPPLSALHFFPQSQLMEKHYSNMHVGKNCDKENLAVEIRPEPNLKTKIYSFPIVIIIGNRNDMFMFFLLF